MDIEKNESFAENASMQRVSSRIVPFMRSRSQQQNPKVSEKAPRPSAYRLRSSHNETAFDLTQVSSFKSEVDATVLYLAYGSNLSAATFLGKRGIKPLSQVNVVVPEIQLTFDLPGIPYSEPCFANTRYRPRPNEPPAPERPPYHKNAWKKGLVGVVYEVTKKDYAHIIATEGGGAGYQDVMVECFILDDDPHNEVPLNPTGTSLKAHTLYAHNDRGLRTSPDYAQPSARYLKLMTDGAAEHDLPEEYQDFLQNIRSFRITTTKQKLGSFMFMLIWGPIFALVFFGAGKVFLRKDGTYPAWYKKLMKSMFVACWASYDDWFYKLFGEGERTIGDDVSDAIESEMVTGALNQRALSFATEKTPLLERLEDSSRLAQISPQ